MIRFVTILFLITHLSSISAQENLLFNQGMSSLNAKDTSSAESYFKQSVSRNRDAASFYELAGIQLNKNTFEARNLALDNLKQAVLREPENTKYRLSYIKLKMDISSFLGLDELCEIVPDNINDEKTLVEIAAQFRELFEKYLNLHLNGNPIAEGGQGYYFEPRDFHDYAIRFLDYSKAFYLKALSMNIGNEMAVLGYARLNAFNGDYGQAVYYLNMLYDKNPESKELNLYLGMYNYQIKDFSASIKHFDKAFSLMGEEERQVYSYNTVIAFLSPDIRNKVLSLSMEEQKKYISKFWETKDPFFLTQENERLTEHYYRVAYANFFLNVPRLNIPGWQTDRGRVFIAFGNPGMTYRIGGLAAEAEIRESWFYPEGRTIHFDSKMYDYFKLDWKSDFVGPRIPPVARIETSADIYDREKNDRFLISELKSPKQYLNPLAINVFRSFTNFNENEIYFSYMLPMPFGIPKIEHEYGLFLLNKNNEFLLKKTGIITEKILKKIDYDNHPNYQNINTVYASLKPGDIRYSFETKTIKDQFVSSLQREFKIPRFMKDSLDLSAVVIASRVAEGTDIPGAIKRKDISIIPKIGSQFTPKETMFIYYELYNLNKQVDGSAEFEQTILIKESDPVETGIPFEKIFKFVVETVTGNKNQVALTSSYKTNDTYTQIYQQLDLSKYKPGKYDLWVSVMNKNSRERVERKCTFELIYNE